MPGFFYQHVPYKPEADWRAYFAQGLQNMLVGLEQQQQEKQQQQQSAGDIQRLTGYQQTYQQPLQQAETLRQSLMGMTPEQAQGRKIQWPAHQNFPELSSQQGQQLAVKQLIQKLLSPEKTLSPSQEISQERLQKYRQTGEPSWIQPGLIVHQPFEAGGLEDAELEDYQRKLRDKKTTTKPEYDIKEVAEYLYDYTHDQDGNYVDLDSTNEFALKEMLKGTPYKLAKITTQKFKDRQWPIPNVKEKKQWVLQHKRTGQMVEPTETVTREPAQPGLEAESKITEAPVGLEDIWGQISDGDKTKIKNYLAQGYSVEEIKNALVAQ